MRKILAVLMMFCMSIMMIGCNKVGEDFLSEVQKTYDWEAVNSKTEMQFSIKADNANIKFVGELNSYMEPKNMDLQGDFTIKNIEVTEDDVQFAIGQNKISPIKIILKDNVMYMSTSFIKDLAQVVGDLAGEEVTDELETLTSDYISINLADIMNLDDMPTYNEKMFDIFKGMDTELNLTQNGREYSIELTDKDIVPLLKEVIFGLMSNDELKEQLVATGEVTEEEYAEVKEEIQASMDGELSQLENLFKESKVKVTYKFADDNYTADITCNINAEEENLSMNMSMKQTNKKASIKAITTPAADKVSNIEDLIPSYNVAVFEPSQVISQGNTTYIPLKEAMNQLEIPVKYNAKTKAITIVMDDKEVKVVTKNIKGVSYITSAEVEKLGFEYSEDEDGYIYIN